MVWYDMVKSVSIVKIYYYAKYGVPSLKIGRVMAVLIFWTFFVGLTDRPT